MRTELYLHSVVLHILPSLDLCVAKGSMFACSQRSYDSTLTLHSLRLLYLYPSLYLHPLCAVFRWCVLAGCCALQPFRTRVSERSKMSLRQQGAAGVADQARARVHRRSESEVTSSASGVPRPLISTNDSPRWRGGGGSKQRYGWKTNDSTNAPPKGDGNALVSLADLIRNEDKVPATLLYEHTGDTDVAMDARDIGAGGLLPHQAMIGGAVGMQEALQAAEHGNSVRLSKFLQDGGSPDTLSRLHHLRWSLLHLAAGCSSMGGRLAFASHRRRPEPDCNDGYATCVSELLAAGADPNVTSSSLGYTPLMSAAFTGSKECCWLLLRAGARLDMRADDGRTAFDFAQKARSENYK